MPSRGVVVGKFCPFHRGHRHLIESALAECDDLTILVCIKATDTIDGELRRSWIAATHPSARVLLVDQDELGLADDDTRGWATATVELLGGPPDVAFTSEDYGDPWAAAMGCRHVSVDAERSTVPVSASAIRADPLGHLDALDPPVRAHFVRRVAVVGAESTGKTTLAQDLAERYGSVWVPEYGRIYFEVGHPPAAPWRSGEFEHIARVQCAYEDALAGCANRVLFCDTDAFTTARFHEAYLGEPAPDAVEALAAARRYDLFLLCDPETPFVQDGGRLTGEARRKMHAAQLRRLRSGSAPWLLVRGRREERVERAVVAVDRLL